MQSFYAALRELEDAMVTVNTFKEKYEIKSGQFNSEQSAADLSWVRYEGGMTSYLEVLDVQRSLFTAQLKTSETLQQQLSLIVRLFKALDGGWVPTKDTTSYYNQSIEQLNKIN